MKNSLSALLAVALLGLVSTFAHAEEPAARFLKALRENGYHELAIEYLTHLENSDLVSPEFKKTIPFEKAEMLIDSLSRIRNLEEWESRLSEAENLLKQFAAASNEPDVIAKTNLIRGNMYRQRARVYLRQGESDRLTAAEKKALAEKTREMLGKSAKNYAEAQSKMASYLKDFQIDPADPESENKWRRLRSTFTQIRYNIPVVTEQRADTYPMGSPQYKLFLKQALDEYRVVSEKYPKFRAGLDAALSSARCEYKLENDVEALFILEQFFELQSTSKTKDLRRRAILLGTQCWDRQDPFPFQEVITVCEPTVRILSKPELRESDWLQVQLVLAKAYRAKAQFVSKEKKPGVAAHARRLNSDAVRMAKNVARTPGPSRDPARALLADWNLKISDSKSTDAAPESFVDARQKGQDVVSDIESIMEDIAAIRAKPASTPEEQKAIQTELDDAKLRLSAQSDMALGFFQLALSMKDDQTEREELNRIRYYQSFCYFTTQRYYESALIGEFLFDHYPSLNWTRQSVALSIRSYVQLIADSPDEDHEFEIAKLNSLTRHTLTKWPGSNEASLAARLSAVTAMQNGDFDTAIELLEKIPADYPSRSRLAARLGQKLWFQHKSTANSDDEASQKVKIQQAKKYLLDGLKDVELADLNYEEALAALLLVDAHLALGENELALKRLESEKIAPLDLVKAQHQAIFGSKSAKLFVKETYKSAIKAYLVALKSGKNQQDLINRVRGVIQALQADAEKSDNPNDKRRLTTIYRMIATELKSQFDSMNSPEEKTAFGNTIATFLGSIEQNATDARTVLWAGSTLLAIATSLKQDSIDDAAKPLFKQAVSALTRAEKIGFKNQPNAKAYSIELRRQRALAERGAGNYDSAISQFSELLKESPNQLNIQIDAALTLHQSAKASSRADGFREAMMGRDEFRDPKTRKTTKAIWGWRKIFSATRNNKKFTSQFTTATFYLIESRFEYGKLKPSDKAIKSAATELKNFKRRDPSLGGTQWKKKFEELEKRINNKLK